MNFYCELFSVDGNWNFWGCRLMTAFGNAILIASDLSSNGSKKISTVFIFWNIKFPCKKTNVFYLFAFFGWHNKLFLCISVCLLSSFFFNNIFSVNDLFRWIKCCQYYMKSSLFTTWWNFTKSLVGFANGA